MKQLRNIWFLTIKDLKIFTADRGAFFFSILFPFLFVILFNFILKGVGSEDSRLQLNLATREPLGGISYQIITALETKDESALKPGEPQIIWLEDYEQAKKDVEDNKLSGFIAFPEDFSESVLMGYSTELEVIYNPSNPQAIAPLEGMAQAIANIIGSLMEKGLVSPDAVGDLSQFIQVMLTGQSSVTAESPMISFAIEKVGDVEAINPANFVIPGYLVMFVFMTASFAAQLITRERLNHTMERLLTTSASRSTILGGIYTGTVVKGMIQMIIFWGIGILVFKMDLGIAPAAVFIISILMMLMGSAFGVMLSTFVKTERSASSIGVLASLIMAPLGGCWWPLFITPRWYQFIAKITPHAWANTAFNKLLVFGADFDAVIPEMLVLIAFATVFGTIAVLKFRTDAD
ncbi:MAG TPA: ABC transporter permease [Dehalococcoidales bacterium]